jgi:hypothetical protein
MKKNDGGAAFPLPMGSETTEGNQGMSLRDYFAGQAIIGLVGHGNNVKASNYDPTATIADVVADQAYFIADAMLQARLK